MKSVFVSVITFIMVCLSSSLKGQQKYNAIIVTKLKQQYTGTIFVNLNGTNDELIEIETLEKIKTKQGGKRTTKTITTQLKLNLALISNFIINDTTYYFRDIKYDYNEKYYMNSCVRLIEGNLDCGLFQVGNTPDINKLAVKLPKAELSKLIAVTFDYYMATAGWHIMNFGDCEALRTKMEKKEEGYKWDDATPQEQRLVMWKKWIKEFNSCTKK